MAGNGRDSARAKSGQWVLQDYDIFENDAVSSSSPNFTSPRTSRCPPLKQDGISARNVTNPSERLTESVKFIKQEIQQRSRGLNAPRVPRTTGNVRPPSMVTKKNKVTFLTKLREERRRQLCCRPLTQGLTREEVQNALHLFETIRLEIPKSGHQSAEALRKMRRQYPHFFLYSKGNEGTVPGVEEGMKVDFRAQLSLLGIHRPLQKGIDWKDVKHYRTDGNSEILAISVVFSGEYEDDTDEGEKVIYTGEGGRDPTSGRQIANQILEKGNLALYNSYFRKNSIRFVRCESDANSVSGKSYSYDGLYKVEDWERVIGVSEFVVFKFELVREAGQKPLDWSLRLPKPKRREEDWIGDSEEDFTEDSGQTDSDEHEEEAEEMIDSKEEVSVTASPVASQQETKIANQEEWELPMDIDDGLAAIVNEFSRYDMGISGPEGNRDVSREPQGASEVGEGHPAEDNGDEPEYEVEKILQKRTVRRGKRRQLEYFILWKDYSLEDATWEPAMNLTHCPAKLEEFERSYKK